MSASTYAQHVSTKQTPQSEPILGSSQVKNSAGGYSFPVDDWTRLHRFLVLGSEGGSYYASERNLTRDNAQVVLRCADADPARTVNFIRDISVSGRAPKNDQAIFALAMLSAHPKAKQAALAAVSDVCRTSTHIFQFVECAEQFRGWGHALRRSVANFYLSKEPRDVAYQMVKYQQRNGWSHRDLLRLSHPKVPPDSAMGVAFDWVSGRDLMSHPHHDELEPIYAFESAKQAATAKEIVALIENHGLVRECIPTKFLNDPEVWDALLVKMPMMAMIRNLGKMSAVGLLKPMSAASQVVAERLRNQELISRSRIHPLSILMAASVYRNGKGLRGSLSWLTDRSILEALDDSFVAAFDGVEPTGKRHLIAVDVSDSMTWCHLAGTFLTPRDAAAALSLVTVRTEKLTHTVSFSCANGNWYRHQDDRLEDLGFDGRTSLDSAIKKVSTCRACGTDCALPMIHALKHKIEADVFVVLTDSETWAGNIHPVQALREYRDKMGIPSKLIVVGMVSNGFTIADPNDGGMMDVVGFDSSAPSVMADFTRA